MQKQTAVDWLVEQLCIEHRVTLIEKAKQIERQQIIDALKIRMHCCGMNDDPTTQDAEQYYNETFGK